MKRYLTIFALFMFAVVLFGCSTSSTTNHKTEKDKEQYEWTDGVSDSQLMEDIATLKSVQNGVAKSEYTPAAEYTIDLLELEKRQTNIEDKEDVVYVFVTISNKYYRSVLNYSLLYNYYDQGGWILDGSSLVNSTTVPISGVDKNSLNSIEVEIKGKDQVLSSQYITSIDFDEEKLTSTINYYYADDVYEAEGQATIQYKDGKWDRLYSEDFVLNNVSVNWGSGHFTGFSTDKDSLHYYPSNFPGGSMGYFVKEENKYTTEYNYRYIEDPDYYLTDIYIYSIDTKNHKISGSVRVHAEFYRSLYNGFHTLEEDEYWINFECPYNQTDGSFRIYTTMGILTRRAVSPADRAYYQFNYEINLKYSFDQDKWVVDTFVMASADWSDGYYFCTYNTMWNNTHR